ncbi:MAG: RNA polymerase sigma-70 factor [Bacteroidales bacterium]|nr:RNA polymerase sigma-70 factor [Bacteroides sp.]MCM1197994.1 RNA polymerase sigma-70 factor [Clostridium sp.]MCM1502648.1 RNA polymerase sigma-70 factor [Bacteroidales bacterium]
MPFNETELIMKMKNDSREAFFIFYQKYLPVVETFASSLVKDTGVAREIAQNVFVRIWDRRRSLDNIESFRGYLFRMTKNAVYDYFHTYRSRAVSFDDMSERIDLSGFAVEGEGPDIDSKNMLMKVLIEMDRLPAKCRKVFIMSRLLGMKNREIAESMSLSVKTVEYHISSALTILRKKVKI